ncbi:MULTISPECIES: signal peptidase II [unclassified Agrobacterium]|jgi:signal peptidase II|uniref:Lipoprotein signal peptidase n=1 Tax=Agrobacterium fabrum TaxID=1176649 RepID=A0A2W5F703_9HYPH|nr:MULTISPECIES: signal peptidase II [unclassified Agrobacterium]PZP50573.1 MAG: signal peptidase II [Agrobacterium fabrum]MDH0613009.1 signal peptidase II [Agrobacterium sp. GD03872]MDH0694874.1 signal peptidase II [Agrobacterium sp. GD03871]MDH1057728.1 signal peptidase II [Agrobacterium sp. GD03992]MDH2209017.1 signal peptidase II [Agrobacterium sp. GD03643]
MAKAALFSKIGPAFALIVAALVLDQIVKQLVEAYLPMQEMVPVVPFLALYRTYNLGVAFSMLSDMEGWFIVSMRLVIVVFVLWLWRKTAADRTFAHLGFAFIIAGAAGNLLDRFFYGHVIDYILFHTQTWSFAVFNLADTFITIGAGCVILDEFLHARAAKK